MEGDVILSFERWVECWKNTMTDHIMTTTQVGLKITQDNRDSTELMCGCLFLLVEPENYVFIV